MVGNLAYVADYYYFGIYDCSAATTLPVAISLFPLNPPILIPPSGGSFNYSVTVANNSVSTQNIAAWVMMQLPGGAWYGPTLGPMTVSLHGVESCTREYVQTIIASAPAGEYLFEARVGHYPDSVWHSDNFPFTKEEYSFVGADSFLHLPGEFKITASPNPFNPSTAISYQLSANSHVSLRIYDTAGRLVSTLVNGYREAGSHEVTFDGTSLPSGVYLYRLEAGEFSAVGKMVLLK